MPGTFAGKYAFRSTNTTGTACYLTSYVGESSVYPSVSAPALTDAEKVILYAQPDGSYVVVLAVPAQFTDTISLAYLTGQPELGFVTTDPAAANAQGLRISALGPELGSWSVLDTGKNSWTGLAYIPTVGSMQVLTYADRQPGPPRPPYLTALVGVPVTPGYAALAQGKQGQKADLRYTDLSGLDLSGVDFTGADFTGANLTRTKFCGATLTNAVFTGATMQGTDVTGATLDGATLSGLDLCSVVWGTGISAAGAHLEGSLLVGCTIGSSDAQANLSGAFFNNADLGGADLTGANLGSAHLSGANLTGAVLGQADLTLADLGGSAGISPAILSYATLYGATTRVSAAATAEQADFSNAYLEGISFAGSNLQGARFDGACLVGADFTGASLGVSAGNGMPASFAGACLAGAKLGGAAIAGTNFANAALSFASGAFLVRYCTAEGPMPPPPGTMPVNCHATTGLDLTTLRRTTICPNGRTFAANQALGVGLRTMLTAPGAPTSWVASSCLVSGGSVGAAGALVHGYARYPRESAT
jgi:uncharacterized protein YjbI with pentapeptide repeats